MQTQSPGQSHRPAPTNGFKPGVSGNSFGSLSRAKQKALVLGRAAELAEEFGGLENLSAVERTLLEQAAELSLSRPRRSDQRLRKANVLNRILRDMAKRRGLVVEGRTSSFRERIA